MKDFDPGEELQSSRRRLPHWQQDGCTYFVTFRLHDSIPKGKLNEWNEERFRWLRSHQLDTSLTLDQILQQLNPKQKKIYYETYWKGYHDSLDACHGSCVLQDPNNSEILADALLFFDGDRYALGDFVVMPNHVHLLVTPSPNESLKQILHSWKRHSARAINQRIHREGQLWQHESYDHIVRNAEQLKRIQKYIANNPKNLKASEFVYHKVG